MNTPKTKGQIAQDLGISLRTLQRWLKKSNLIIPRGLVCPKQQKDILEAFGYSQEHSKKTE